MQNRRAHSVFIQGWEAGYRIGQQDGRRSVVDAAERGAERFYALEATDVANRALVADTAKSLDVPRFQQRPTVVPTIKPKPTLDQFLRGLRKGGVLTDIQEVEAA